MSCLDDSWQSVRQRPASARRTALLLEVTSSSSIQIPTIATAAIIARISCRSRSMRRKMRWRIRSGRKLSKFAFRFPSICWRRRPAAETASESCSHCQIPDSGACLSVVGFLRWDDPVTFRLREENGKMHVDDMVVAGLSMFHRKTKLVSWYQWLCWFRSTMVLPVCREHFVPDWCSWRRILLSVVSTFGRDSRSAWPSLPLQESAELTFVSRTRDEEMTGAPESKSIAAAAVSQLALQGSTRRMESGILLHLLLPIRAWRRGRRPSTDAASVECADLDDGVVETLPVAVFLRKL